MDYLAGGATRYIGSPKTPTISVYVLAGGEYQLRQCRGRDRVISATFPELAVTAEAIFGAADF